MFEIHMGDTIVGSADVKQKGLYYYVTCACKPPSKEIHRIIMYDGSVRKDLGICVPSGNAFALSVRVPVKCFYEDEFTFELVRGTKGEYVIFDNMPFPHLDKLEAARLQHTNGQPRLIIDLSPIPQDSGQIPEHQNR